MHQPELNQVTKVLLYAPGDETGLSMMKEILSEIGIEESTVSPNDNTEEFKVVFAGYDGTTAEIRGRSMSDGWRLLPMVSPNLQSSDLGDILQHALDRVVEAPWN